MANLSEILSRRFPGNQWRLDADDYTTLDWRGPDPKPLEVDIRSFSAAVDTELAAEARSRRQERALMNALERQGELIHVIGALALALNDLQDKIRPQSLTSPLAAAALTQIDDLVAKVNAARSVV